MKPVQIVITRKSKDIFRVTIFDRKECKGSKLLNEREAAEIIRQQIKRLGLTSGLEGEGE